MANLNTQLIHDPEDVLYKNSDMEELESIFETISEAQEFGVYIPPDISTACTLRID